MNSARFVPLCLKVMRSRVPFVPEDGMKVIVRGSVQVYERDGIYQIYCETMVPDGIGALYLAFEQRKKKLEAAGLFDPAHKRPLPAYPQCIGIVYLKNGCGASGYFKYSKKTISDCTCALIPGIGAGRIRTTVDCGCDSRGFRLRSDRCDDCRTRRRFHGGSLGV